MYSFSELVFRDVTFAYQGEEIISHLSASFERGMVTSIIGKSGSGKSTLLALAGGILVPTSGDVLWGNRSTRDFSSEERSVVYREAIRFLFQYHYLLDELTVRENIALPFFLATKSTYLDEETRLRLDEIIDIFELNDQRDAYPQFLSGGQRQRVALGRALLVPGSFILADEPTGELDAETGQILTEYLIRSCKKLSMGALIVTHDERLTTQTDTCIKL